MITIRVSINADSSKADTKLISEVTATSKEDELELVLGKVLFAVEEMGYPFVTDEVYKSAIDKYKVATLNNRYTTVFSNDIMIVSLRRTV